ncbi:MULTISPECIES: DUF2730 family protein [Citrobacter freundii complex]|uniref:DUF2730 family protein n=1 Tax=Citrobacter freundii complex TaxID=1344959 RepID=UPI001495B998|nr:MULTISPECIES: DUF2730 family protein [Citrobacter freundii complex]EGP0948991.1 DUF2730 family protein [Salmonella enterica subsp. enterica serovar Java]ELW9327615.1 DUF2730 family protein [Citrobacter freundii]ELW9351814.1 DUF2730 family protein [Citrobacter freundii]EMF0719796.1 DUF2730 family protein [Citrobacter freundii]MCR3700810.1 DUF2730 domain-containing protein [Citrobacter portucalensis]
MDWEVVKGNWAIIWALFMSGVNLLHLLLAKTYARREEMEKVSSRLNILEKAVEGMPTRQELHNLQLDMSNLRGEIREFSGTLRQASRISDLLLENELKEK